MIKNEIRDVDKERLTDIHVHLDQYIPAERERVLRRANAAGLRWIVTAGMDLQSSAQAVKIATAHKQVLASVGIHPWVAAETDLRDLTDKIRYLALDNTATVVAISEVGLDFVDNAFTGASYHSNENLREAQERIFRQQVDLACELALPLIIHCRGAYSTLISILQEERAYRVCGVIHNFDGDKKTADQLLNMGFYLSFGGAITYPTATTLQKIVRHVPLDRILIETDSPYMPLYLQLDEKNEPANVVQIARTLAKVIKVDSEEFIDISYTNFKTLLKIAMPDDN